MRNKVLPSMLFGAAVAMGATTVFGLTPGTAATRGDGAEGETDAAASRALQPGTVALAGTLPPPPAATAAPVTTVVPSPRTGDASPGARGGEDRDRAGAARSAPSVPSPRARAAAPPQRPATESSRAPLVGGVVGTADAVVEGAGKALGDTGRAVTDTGQKAVDGAGRAVGDVTGTAGRVVGGLGLGGG